MSMVAVEQLLKDKKESNEKQKIGSRYQKYSTLKWRPDAIDKIYNEE